MRPDLPGRGVKSESGKMAGAIGGSDTEGAPMPENEVQKIAVRHLDALWLSGGSGSVNDISQVIARYGNGFS